MNTADLKSRLSNFWYYHKNKVFAGLFFLIVIVYGVRSCILAVRSDVSIVVAGDFFLQEDDEMAFEQELAKYATDTNGDGTVQVGVISLDLSDKLKETSPKVAKVMQDKMTVEIMAGDSYIFILKKSVYDFYSENSEVEIFENLKDAVGLSEDTKFIPISKTALIKTSYGKDFPDDMVVALRRKSFFGGEREREYEAAVEMLKKLING